ncbi:MAG: trypsin-like peptidase domain-containing protein [Thermoguttaceae bacterium]|jgi:hypothetical protein
MFGSRNVVAYLCRLAAVVPLPLAMFWPAGVSQAAIAKCLEATCRITAHDGSCGSGCVLAIDRGQVYVLTAAHVVADASAVRCEFWRQGHQSQPLPGSVVRRWPSADAAVVGVAESAFGGMPPAAIPLAAPGRTIRPGETLASVGCAGGSWSTGWVGHALVCAGDDLHFVPAPANGRSGSAIFDADGRHILAVVRARSGDNSEGIATSVQAIYRSLDADDQQMSAAPVVEIGHHWRDASATQTLTGTPATGTGPATAWQLTDCGPGGCPLCPPLFQNRLLPNRPNREAEGRGPYPTLPPPAVDVKPLDEKLQKITDLLTEIEGRRSKESSPAEPAADAQARRMAQEALQGAGQALETAKAAHAETARIAQLTEGLASQVKDVAAQTNKLNAAQEKTNEAIQKHGTLGERIELLKQRVDERVGEDASRPEKIRAFIHEAVTDKTEWLRMGLIVALALPLLIFVIDYAHHKKTGDPLLIEKLATQLGAVATQQPMLAPAANLASHAANDVTGLLALLNQQTQAQLQRPAAPTVVVTPAQPAPAAAAPAAAAAPVAAVAPTAH